MSSWFSNDTYYLRTIDNHSRCAVAIVNVRNHKLPIKPGCRSSVPVIYDYLRFVKNWITSIMFSYFRSNARCGRYLSFLSAHIPQIHGIITT